MLRSNRAPTSCTEVLGNSCATTSWIPLISTLWTEAIFLCVLAYHLLAAIEHRFLQAGVHTSWGTIRDQLRTHQVITIVLPDDHHGRVLTIRKATTPEPEHRQIYATLGIPAQMMQPVKTWQVSAGSDEKNPKS